MAWYLALAAKSFVLAGGTLLLLKALQNRSASDRSWIAHLGLAALLFLPIATFVVPALDVPGPSFLSVETAVVDSAAEPKASNPLVADAAPEVVPASASFPEQAVTTAEHWSLGIDWTYAGYLVPAALLILLTLIAIGRLIMLKSRAQVLVDAHWLSALARAQQRMGFKSGTALLTSSELRSPVSWGLMRPVIVLNDDAALARDDAEAIIAHELAHVARLDWAKLLLARIAVALFWFNPFAWLLAREAHQLREEAADDAVLGSDIDDTDYARLLVGVARHECNGLLLGAHGVAPSRNSLSRRVRRVLDQALTRAPGGWRWTSAAAFFAAGMAVPVAALNFVPTTPVAPVMAGPASTGGKGSTAERSFGASSIADRTDAALAAAAISTVHPQPDDAIGDDTDIDIDVDVDIDDEIGRSNDGLARASDAMARAKEKLARLDRSRDKMVEDAIAAKIHGVTADYAREIRAASPGLRNASTDDLVGFRIHGVTPQMVRDLSAAGYPNLSVDDVETAAVHKIDAAYVRRLAEAGYRRLSWDKVVDMKVMGLTPGYVKSLSRRGYRNLTPDQMIKMKVVGAFDEDAPDSR